jgi:hypothetical protein
MLSIEIEALRKLAVARGELTGHQVLPGFARSFDQSKTLDNLMTLISACLDQDSLSMLAVITWSVETSVHPKPSDNLLELLSHLAKGDTVVPMAIYRRYAELPNNSKTTTSVIMERSVDRSIAEPDTASTSSGTESASAGPSANTNEANQSQEARKLTQQQRVHIVEKVEHAPDDWQNVLQALENAMPPGVALNFKKLQAALHPDKFHDESQSAIATNAFQSKYRSNIGWHHLTLCTEIQHAIHKPNRFTVAKSLEETTSISALTVTDHSLMLKANCNPTTIRLKKMRSSI